MRSSRGREWDDEPELPLDGGPGEGSELVREDPPWKRDASDEAAPPEAGEGGGDVADDEDEEEGLSELERIFRRARAALEEGRVQEAIARYREIVARDPRHVRARHNLGVLLDGTGSRELAIEQFQAALEEEPENVEVLSNLGAVEATLGRFDQAERHLKRAVRLDPFSVDVRANLGILYFRRGLYAEAESEFRWVCDRDGEHAAAHFYRGESLNRLGFVDEALETLERASRLDPRNPRTYYVMGILYDRKHLQEEAGAMFRKARDLSGGG